MEVAAQGADSRAVGGSAPVRQATTPREWACLALLCGALVSPPIWYWISLGTGRRTLDLALLWNIAMSGAWLLALHAFVRRPLRLHLALIPLYVAAAADMFLVVLFGSRLNTSYLSIIISDGGEAGEFMGTYSRPILVGAAILVSTWSLGAWGIRRMTTPWPPWLRWATLVLLVAGYAAPVAWKWRQGTPASRSALDVVSHDSSSPMGVLSQLGVTVALMAETHQSMEARRSFSFGARSRAGDEPEVYVLVIGDSSRPDHWSMNGYRRETTPRLARTPNLVFFRDVVSTNPVTSIAVPSLLSLAPSSDWPAVQSQASIVRAFREAGFFTWWLSTQEVSHWGGIIHVIGGEAHRTRYYDRGLDGVLVRDLRSILDDPARPRKLLVVLHTRGSHFEFAARYPPEDRVYPEQVATRAEYVANTYDNSILYTDRILSDIIGQVEALQVRSAVLFVSDHGENLYDDDRQLLGHALGNEFDVPTVALAWWSRRLEASSPGKIAAVRRAAAAPLVLANFSHSLVDLADIEARGLDRGMSVFSGLLREDPRYFVTGGQRVEWKGKRARP